MTRKTLSGVALLTLVTAAGVAVSCVPKGGGAAASDAPVGAPSGGNLIKNADFEDGTALPWNSSFSPPANGEFVVVDGAACLTINDGGTNKWDAQVRHREMVIQQNHTYTISFKIWSDKPTMAGPKISPFSGTPEAWNKLVHVTEEPQTVTGQFTMRDPDSTTYEFAFHLGGQMLRDTELPVTVCLDDIYLSDPQYIPPPKEVAAARPAVRINQLGYFKGAKKIASVVTDASGPVPFQVLLAGQPVLEGQTEPFGLDTDSGQDIHIVDFTSVKKEGRGYTIKVGENVSPTFDIRGDIYSQLKYDALNYYYQNRSGIALEMPYARQEKWTRPAGHASSDKSVPCAELEPRDSPDLACSYSLDVTQGWYDAGDHGKYVVNGGIAVWTLMNQYERFKARGDVSAFGDGKLNIPESGNGIPDILDEARWQMEFMLKMQVPDGQPHAGMVHHKMHDTAWSALAIAPHEAEAKYKRHLRPVSTAATLNLAATAAQASRIWQSLDPTFSAKCLAAAEKAWTAAKQHPAIYAPPWDNQKGGGPYDDKNVEDEFFWAAAELFITTRTPTYSDDMKASKWWTQMNDTVDGVPSVMNWQNTDGLGTLSLTTVPGALAGQELRQQQKKVIDAADRMLILIPLQGYRMPFSAGDGGKYPWGSNSFIINNAMVMGFAYDFTKKDQYLEGMVLSMDYLLGRNALAQSYVSGYGKYPLKWPHHRFWSAQVDPRFPAAPPGALSGGPNSGLQDPYVKAAGLQGCMPQQCFIDNIEAWSVNEITVNWNAPFAWVLAYLDENGKKARAR